MKKFIIIAGLIVTSAFFVGFSANHAKNENKVVIYIDGYDRSMGNLYTFQDPETGVWYYAVHNAGVTPRYNADGTMYTGR